MNELENSRNEISRIDREMARLFEERMKISEDIADYKIKHCLSVRDIARETVLIEKNSTLIKDSDIAAYYVRFMKNVINLSCDLQSEIMNGMKVAYCGVEGAFSHIAAKRMFPTARYFSFPDFNSAYDAVENGEFDCAVLPLENSSAGEVGTVIDLIFAKNLFINQVIDIDIEHHLVACRGASVDRIKTVVSHPQALSQCDEYIRTHGFETVSCANTAIAAMKVKEQNDPTVAAIASDETAKLYGLDILDSRINDEANNTTRFAAFSRTRNEVSAAKKRADESFILVFTVKNEAGALAQTLNIIGAHGFNMRNLRSRPMKDLLWNYYFFVEAEGDMNTENGHDMLRELSAVCAELKLVGTYNAKNMN